MDSNRTSRTLYPFKLIDAHTQKWRKVRWKASLEEIERLGGEVCGEGFTPGATGYTSDFLRDVTNHPYPQRSDRVETNPHWENPPAIDPLERFMARTFLRRYATWCVRTGRYAAVQGAACLYVI